MVRETRHLWIGNLPENVREEQIRDLFQRHGRVQSVKIVPEDNSTSSGENATVSFIDIRSAAKALRGTYSLAGQPLHIKYYEPNAVPRDIGLPDHDNSSPSNGPLGDSSSEQGNSQSTSSGGHGPSTINMNNNGPLPGGNNNLGGPYRRFPPMQHGQSEESSHFYEQPKSYNRGRGDGHFHSRGRRDHRNSYHNRHQYQSDRNYGHRMSSNSWNYHNENRFAPPVHSDLEDRTSGPSPVSHNSSNETGNKVPQRCPESPAGSVSARHMSRHKSRSVSESGSSDRGSSAGSRSRSGSHSSVSTSVSSGQSRSPGRRGAGQFSRGGSMGSNNSGRFHRKSFSRQRYSRSQLVSRPADSSRVHHSSRSSPVGASPSSSNSSSPSPHRKIVSNPHSPSRSPSSTKSYSPSRTGNTGHHNHSASSSHRRRPPNNGELACAIRIRNLPSRSSDTSLKDGLFHEYKKHGKVSWVRISGTGSSRYAVVCFKSADQATRAVTVSQDKQFFGCKIQVSTYFDSSGRMNGGTDEVISGADEENQMVNEDDLPSVPYPTRSVLINGLDATITDQELRQAFEQYGDIVEIDIRKVGINTHAVCEFVDIASAIRAQWGRYVFKSKDARISFFRNVATNSLLLDGTAKKSEKEVYSHCCQYGAIKKVIMDPARILALVQFETISSAQTAIRELRRWVINRKHLHVDFASVVCMNLFIDRLKNLPSDQERNIRNSALSVEPVSQAHYDTKIHRKFSEDLQVERKTQRRKDITVDGGAFEKLADELVSSENSNTCYINRPVEFGGHTMENQLVSGYRPSHVSNRHDLRTSPVSPDGEACHPNQEKLPKSSSSGSKIDLSCHETDSAIVTSSSDVICPDKDPAEPSVSQEFEQGHSSRDTRCQDSGLLVHDSLTMQPTRKFNAWKKPNNVIVTVDGVSSTSPEPKSEAIHKVSPDPGIGSGFPVLESRRILSDYVGDPPVDPRLKVSEDPRRRTSADSAHQDLVTSRISRNSNSTDSLAQRSSADDSPSEDDRPGTPLCDEIPESFSSSDSTSFTSKHRIEQKTTGLVKSSSKTETPLTLPLPEFALQKQSGNKPSVHGKPSEKILISQSPTETVSNDVQVLTSLAPALDKHSAQSENIIVVEDTSKTSSDIQDDHVQKDLQVQIELQDSESKVCEVGAVPGESSQLSEESILAVDEHSNSPLSFLKDEISDNMDNDDVNSLSSSDSESKPRNSPTSDQLEQRIQQLYEKYDQWSGSRSAVKAVTVPNSSLNFTLSTDMASTKPGETVQSLEQSSLPSSLLNKPWFSRTKPWSLDEKKHEPSDIVKSLLAKKSVFDEDSKRLENFEEKYEAKALTNITSTNWRQALNRSASSPASSSLLSPLLNSSPLKTSTVFSTTPTPSCSGSRSTGPGLSPSPLFGMSKGTSSVPSPTCSPIIKRRDSGHVDTLKLDIKPGVKSNSISSPVSDVSVSSKSTSSSSSHHHRHSTSELSKGMLTRPAMKVKHSSLPEATNTKAIGSPCTPISEKEVTVHRTPGLSDKIAQSPGAASSPQVGIHQGIPRMVERSTSLDSKRSLCKPQPAESVAGTTLAASQTRRTSSDLGHQLQQGQSIKEHSQSHFKLSHVENLKTTTQNLPKSEKEKELLCPKEKTKKPASSFSHHHNKEMADSKALRYENMLKVDPGLISQFNEPTVAVVATVQTQAPVLQSQKSSGNSTGNPDKDKTNGVNNNCGKRDKDTYLNNSRGHQSGSTNPPINNSNVKSGLVPSNQKLPTEKRDKIPKSKPEMEATNHHNGEKKKNKTSDIAHCSSSQSHKKEKDKESGKIRRAQHEKEKDQEAKKPKLDKDTVHNSKESKTESAHVQQSTKQAVLANLDRRESADSHAKMKSSNKEKVKTNFSASEQNSTTKPVSVEKSESSMSSMHNAKPDKDHNHHKSKNSTSKLHHMSSEKVSSTTQTSHSHKHKEKKDSSSSNKERDKGHSKAHEEKVPSSSKQCGTSGETSHKHVNHQRKEKESSSGISKTKEREREKPKASTSSSILGSIDSEAALEIDQHKQNISYQPKKKDKVKTENSKPKIDNHKKGSGGESSSAPGALEICKINSKGKVKQQKKRRRIVDTDSDSSSDGDEQKHHSIFEVVVDEYVSMYDKVKARSNRACKKTPQQQKEEQSKQDKLQEQFQQLKKSRAKREEKKRSISTDEKKIDIHFSSDEHSKHSDSDEGILKISGKPKDKNKGSLSSDEDENGIMKSSKSKHNSSRSKSKHTSGKAMKRPKKLEQSPKLSAGYFMSTSDPESEEEPFAKKQKLGSKHQNASMVSKGPIYSSSSESDSDLGHIEKPVKSKSSSIFVKNKHLQKKMSIDVYTESDNSVKSSKTKKTSSHQSVSSNKSKKDKSSKQKSIDAMKKSLFDYSESSDESSKITPFSPKKEKGSTKSISKSKSKDDKENKTSRKKESSPYGHRASGSFSSSSSQRKEKIKHKSHDSRKSSVSRRESVSVTATEADLFGSMSSSDDSGPEIKSQSIVMKDERPPTPPIVSSSNMPEEPRPSQHKSKHSEHKQKKHSTPKKVDLENKEPDGSNHQSSKCSEKKKRKHHKRSRREGGSERPEKHSSPPKMPLKPEGLVDYAALFNSPSPAPSLPKIDMPMECDTFKRDNLFPELTVPVVLSAKGSPSGAKENDVEEGMKSMFSSDEDEEEDANLKIGITEAIMASEDEKLIPSPTAQHLALSMQQQLNEKETADAAKRLEEEIKRNSLFEQDKAIESILMERKSPARGTLEISHLPRPAGANDNQEIERDEYDKNEAAISQEETEDAVAALLGTLDRDDEEEDASAPIEKSAVHNSPPTLRIIEESSPSVQATSERSTSPSNTPTPWYAKSPAHIVDEENVSKQSSAEQHSSQHFTPKTPEEKFDLLKKFTQEYGDLDENNITRDKREEEPGENQDQGSRCGSRKGSIDNIRLSGDVYEFHDSDDEKTRRAKEAAHPSSIPVQISQPQSSVGSISPPMRSPVCGTTNSEPDKPSSPRSESEVPASIETLPQDKAQVSLQVTIPVPEEKSSSEIHPPALASSLPKAPITVEAPQINLQPAPQVNMPVAPQVTLPPTPPEVALPPAPPPTMPPRTSIDDTIDHVIRMANAATLEVSNAFASSSSKPVPVPRRRSQSKSKDINDDQSSAIAAIINRVARNGESQRTTTAPSDLTPVQMEPAIALHQMPKPVIPGLDTRIDLTRVISQKEIRETESVVEPRINLAPINETQHAVNICKQDSDKQFLKQQLIAFQMQPPMHQQVSDKPQIQFSHRQFMQQKEGLASGLALANHHQQQQQLLEHTKNEQQKQLQQQHRTEIPQHSPTVKPSMSSPTGQKPAIIYTTTTSEPYMPPKFSGLPPPEDRVRFFAPNVYQISGMQPQEVLSHGHRGFPEVRQPHPTAVPTSLPVTSQQNQVQAQLVRIPEIPSATTITKVNSRGEERPSQSINMIQQHASVIFTSADQGPVIRTSIPVSHQLQINRLNENYLNQNAPRIEITSNIVQPPLGSPKSGRIPQQFEPNSAQSIQQRILASHHIPFEAMDSSSPVPLDLATQSSNSNPVCNNINSKLSSANISCSPSSPYLQQSRQAMQRSPLDSPFAQAQLGYPPGHYAGPNLQALGGGQPSPTLPFGVRPSSTDNNKNQVECVKPNVPERAATAHIVPPHIASPASDRGSTESPRLTPGYGQRQFFPSTPSQLSISHSPSIPTGAHPHLRQTFLHPYADMEENQFPHGPAFYPPSSIPVRREAERDESEERGTPPPAHISRYRGIHQVIGEVPPGGEIPSPSGQMPIPHQGESLLTLLQKYPIVWQGLYALKNDNAACQMHFVSGNMSVARDSLPAHPDGTMPPLRISQRMRLEQAQLDGVSRKLQTESEHCMLLALPCGRDHLDVLQQSNNLRNGFITYLQLKQAAGIVNIHHPETQMPAFVIHIFPSCDFANENMAKIAPDLLHGVADIAHLFIVIATV